MPDKNFAERTVVSHPGAVAVVALDDAGRVLMIRQYRHPVGYQLWEIPAGLRDAAGEPPLETARRELFEETGYRAREWHVLIDYFTSPGFTTERLRIYLAPRRSPGRRAGRRRGLRPPRRGEVPRQLSGSRSPKRSAWRSRASSTTAPPSPASSPPSQPGQPTSATSAPPTPPNPSPPRHPRSAPPTPRTRARPAKPPARPRRRPEPSPAPPSPRARLPCPNFPPRQPHPTSRGLMILETFFLAEEKHAIRMQNLPR